MGEVEQHQQQEQQEAEEGEEEGLFEEKWYLEALRA